MKVKLFSLISKNISDSPDLKDIVKAKVNKSLLEQVVYVNENRIHKGLSHTKTRSEVKRTKKKLYRQKGTGGARHGSKNAPIFVGGGVAHGPRGIKRFLFLPSKIKKLSRQISIVSAFTDGKAVLCEGFEKIEKTSQAGVSLDALRSLVKIGKGTILVVFSKENYKKSMYFKNIKNVRMELFDNLNAYKILRSSFVIFDSLLFIKAVKKVRKEKK